MACNIFNSKAWHSGPALHYERVVAMYEYNAQGPEELELAPGDLLVVVQKVDDVSCHVYL